MIYYNVLSKINLDGKRKSSMDASRKASREDNEITLQYKSRQEILFDDELAEDKLKQLLEFICQIDQQ